jgi:hypothetical protein
LLRGRVFFFLEVDMANQVKHVVRLVIDVAVEDDHVGESPLTPAMARELAVAEKSRAWLASIGNLRWAVGRSTVISATVLLPSPVVTESDTEDLGMGEPASVPPVAQK